MAADVTRITDMMVKVVKEAASALLGDDDHFDFDVGLTPVIEYEDDDPVFEVAAWAVFRLGCPETEMRSVMGLNAPLRFMSEASFREVVNKTLGEMQFSRIVAALQSDESTEQE